MPDVSDDSSPECAAAAAAREWLASTCTAGKVEFGFVTSDFATDRFGNFDIGGTSGPERNIDGGTGDPAAISNVFDSYIDIR